MANRLALSMGQQMSDKSSFIFVNLEQVILLVIVFACYVISFAFPIPTSFRTIFICIAIPLAVGCGRIWYMRRKRRTQK